MTSGIGPLLGGGGGGSAGFTPAQIDQLGHLCTVVNCANIRVGWSPFRSFAFGNRVFLTPRDRCNLRAVAHEVFHVFQYQTFGFSEYLRRGVNDRAQELSGGNPYLNSSGDRNSLEGAAQASTIGVPRGVPLVGC